MKRYLASLLLLLATACSSNAPPVTSTDSTTAIPATQSPIPPTETSTPTRLAPSPTVTPSPAPTSIANVNQIAVPDWLADPETTVAMLVTDIQGDQVQLSFLNLPTEEFFHLPISATDVRGYFWMPDGRQFGLLLAGFQSVLLVDTTTGLTMQKDIPEETLRFIDKEHNFLYGLEVRPTTSNELDFYLTYFSSPSYSIYSPDMQFLVDQSYDDEESVIEIRNITSDEIIFRTDPQDGLYDVYANWSPTTNLLALLQNTQDSLHTFNPGDRILLLNQNGQLVNQFFGDFFRTRWSPDGRKILYVEVGDESDPIRNYPCILNVYTGDTSCLKFIEQKHAPYGGTGFRWSSSGRYILYSTRSETAEEFCILELATLRETCPTNGWEERENPRYYIGGYSTSPDEQYVILGFPVCPEFCDFYEESESGIFSINDSQYLALGPEIQLTEPYFYYPHSSLLWRPLISP